jgi:hypothetical protein
MAGDNGLERGQERALLLLEGREEATNPRECLGARVRTERAGHLVLDFEHTQVALGLVPPTILPPASSGQAAEVGVSVTAEPRCSSRRT